MKISYNDLDRISHMLDDLAEYIRQDKEKDPDYHFGHPRYIEKQKMLEVKLKECQAMFNLVEESLRNDYE